MSARTQAGAAFAAPAGASRPIRRAVVAAPAPLGAGGLGAAAAEFVAGLEVAGFATRFVGVPPRGTYARTVRSRPFRRAFGMGASRRAVARSVRGAVPDGDWDLIWGCSGAAPVERPAGLRVLHQATRHPAVHWEEVRRGERETGGRGAISRAEVRRGEYELARADLVHVAAAAVREQLVEAGVPAERIVHSHLGVDLGRFAPGPKPERLTVAFVGPLSMGKGVDIVARLAALLGPEATVEVVGGPVCPWSRRLVERAPFVPRPSVAEMLAGAHVFVLPSRSDGFSYSVLEALACGAVPIVTPEVGAAEVVARLDPRLVVEREGFAEAAAALIATLDLDDLAPRARRLAGEFDRRVTATATVAAVLRRAEELGHAGDAGRDRRDAPRRGARPVSGLRILMVLNAPWDRRLGGPRVQVELAEEFRALGHRVDSFSLDDAFPEPARSARLAGLTRNFERRAVAWIRERGAEYDVIDARAGALGASKAELRFDGLLVTRSTGLLAIYEREFIAADRATAAGRGRLLTRVPRRLERTARERRHRQGIANCDLLNVLNSDELAYARDELGIGERTVLLLHGLTRERAAAFAVARRPVGERLAAPVFAFVGSWARRKGSADMAAIVSAARTAAPDARFRLLGTGADAATVVRACGGDPAGIEVVTRFESEALPGLLGDVAAGFLPSYVEGFPFSVLELLAAGAPVVAYDAPGARETLPGLDPTLLVTRGDAYALGTRLGRLLADPARLERLSAGAVALAGSLRWEDIAARTIAAYEARLAELRRGGAATRPAVAA